MWQSTLEGMQEFTETLTAIQAITRAKMEMQATHTPEHDQLNTEVLRLIIESNKLGEYACQLAVGLGRRGAIDYVESTYGNEGDDNPGEFPETVLEAIAKQAATIARAYELIEYRVAHGQALTGYPVIPTSVE